MELNAEQRQNISKLVNINTQRIGVGPFPHRSLRKRYTNGHRLNKIQSCLWWNLTIEKVAVYVNATNLIVCQLNRFITESLIQEVALLTAQKVELKCISAGGCSNVLQFILSRKSSSHQKSMICLWRYWFTRFKYFASRVIINRLVSCSRSGKTHPRWFMNASEAKW